jgi:hypothetical protein
MRNEQDTAKARANRLLAKLHIWGLIAAVGAIQIVAVVNGTPRF